MDVGRRIKMVLNAVQCERVIGFCLLHDKDQWLCLVKVGANFQLRK